jgi:metal-responsive CopG/Arc/MetJ family transcriptional regulator
MSEPASNLHKAEPGSTRFTVSIPAYLYEWGERERDELHLNRSEFVAYLYQHVRDQIEHERRKARYAAAYAKMPTTELEEALTDIAFEILAPEEP